MSISVLGLRMRLLVRLVVDASPLRQSLERLSCNLSVRCTLACLFVPHRIACGPVLLHEVPSTSLPPCHRPSRRPRDVCTPCPCGACVMTAITLGVQRSRSFMVMAAVVRLPCIVWELVLLPGTLPTSSSPCHCPSCLLCSVLTACARVTCALTADLLCEQRSSCDGLSASRTSQPSPCPWCFVHAVLAPLPVRAPFDSIRGCTCT